MADDAKEALLFSIECWEQKMRDAEISVSQYRSALIRFITSFSLTLFVAVFATYCLSFGFKSPSFTFFLVVDIIAVMLGYFNAVEIKTLVTAVRKIEAVEKSVRGDLLEARWVLDQVDE